MAYFFFTKDILKGKNIPIFEVASQKIQLYYVYVTRELCFRSYHMGT